MATVLRVKRRHDSQPQDALVLNCKRPKLTDNDEAMDSISFSTVAKFAGTLKDPKEDVVHHLSKTLNKQNLKKTFQSYSTKSVLSKTRQYAKEISIANRYKVISCLRSLDTLNAEEEENKMMTFIDVEDSVSLVPNQVLATVKENSNCVYDIYYATTEEEVHHDDSICIHDLHDTEFVFETYNEHCSKDPYESEDSNSESNWRNDYPDTDYSDESIDEDDMRIAVNNFSDSESLSSDDENEDLNDDLKDFVFALDQADIDYHGYKYARYKQRMRELFIDEENGNVDSDEEN